LLPELDLSQELAIERESDGFACLRVCERDRWCVCVFVRNYCTLYSEKLRKAHSLRVACIRNYCILHSAMLVRHEPRCDKVQRVSRGWTLNEEGVYPEQKQ
jgi:hypothetical protein